MFVFSYSYLWGCVHEGNKKILFERSNLRRGARVCTMKHLLPALNEWTLSQWSQCFCTTCHIRLHKSAKTWSCENGLASSDLNVLYYVPHKTLKSWLKHGCMKMDSLLAISHSHKTLKNWLKHGHMKMDPIQCYVRHAKYQKSIKQNACTWK